MHELSANRAAINSAGGLGFGTGYVQFGHGDGSEIAQGIEIRLKVSPAAEGVPNTLLLVRRYCRFRDSLFPSHSVTIPWPLFIRSHHKVPHSKSGMEVMLTFPASNRGACGPTPIGRGGRNCGPRAAGPRA